MLSIDPFFNNLIQKYIFIACICSVNNAQSLKKIHAWAQMQVPLILNNDEKYHPTSLKMEMDWSN